MYERASKKRALDSVYRVSAVIACYKDGEAIPIMAERLVTVFTKLNIDYEIIFVNDGSPDESGGGDPAPERVESRGSSPPCVPAYTWHSTTDAVGSRPSISITTWIRSTHC